MKKLLIMVLLCLPSMAAAEECSLDYPICFGINWDTATIGDIYGIDVNVQDEGGWTPLYFAVINSDNPKIIWTLLNAGADVNARRKSGGTPLHLAAGLNNNPKIIRVLLKAGANVNARTRLGFTPLQAAALNGINPKIIEVLLEAGSDPKAENDDGDTAYDIIKENENLKDTSAYWKLHDLSY